MSRGGNSFEESLTNMYMCAEQPVFATGIEQKPKLPIQRSALDGQLRFLLDSGGKPLEVSWSWLGNGNGTGLFCQISHRDEVEGRWRLSATPSYLRGLDLRTKNMMAFSAHGRAVL
eukprot:gene26585-biopygen4105